MNRERYLTEIGQSMGSDGAGSQATGLAAGFLREGYGWALVRGREWERLRTPVGERGWERLNVTTENELLA